MPTLTLQQVEELVFNTFSCELDPQVYEDTQEPTTFVDDQALHVVTHGFRVVFFYESDRQAERAATRMTRQVEALFA